MTDLPLILVKNLTNQPDQTHQVCNQLVALGFDAMSFEDLPFEESLADRQNTQIFTLVKGHVKSPYDISLDHQQYGVLEQIIQALPCDFDALPLETEGESKILKRWTSQLVVEKFKPTVYSYTHNRYGEAEGTEKIRARFSAEVFRRLATLPSARRMHASPFIALREDSVHGPLTVQRFVQSSNLEIRVKRYHIGSPLHRYKFTESTATVQQDKQPLTRWTRFDKPVICFDWRHPLTDEAGNRLADEPLSDDYAGVWVANIAEAKRVALETFLWLESSFLSAELTLVDICFFIDQTGQTIYGEISPDCMRVRKRGGDLDQAVAFDKDLWRNGSTALTLKDQYQALFDRLFSKQSILENTPQQQVM